ncbi:MAG: hypothetical protein HQM11_06415 [SAR324 cluster bacterium]|nr:hypothetical protein [SAR324 cluster bacterium]
MLNFRFELSRFQPKSLMNNLKKTTHSDQLTLVNRIRGILAVSDGH